MPTKTKPKPKAKSKATFTKRICNIVPSAHTERDWRVADLVLSGALTATVATPPASKDLRASWWPVGDQGATGSCVGWASADGVMRYHLVKGARLKQNEALSTRFTWMGSKETDEFTSRPATFIEEAGTSLKAAMDICRKYGAVTDAVLPFRLNSPTMFPGKESEFYAAAAMRKASSYVNMQKNFAQWRAWLAGNGPILVALSVDKSWEDAAKTGGKIDNFQIGTARGGHAVCLVGYRTDGRFIVRNSWGTAWGDKGFGYPSESYINAAFFNESYGITL
jgi:C1A family cysteine protease